MAADAESNGAAFWINAIVPFYTVIPRIRQSARVAVPMYLISVAVLATLVGLKPSQWPAIVSLCAVVCIAGGELLHAQMKKKK